MEKDEDRPDELLGAEAWLAVGAGRSESASLLVFDSRIFGDTAVIHSARLEVAVGESWISRGDAFRVSNVLEPWEASVTWNDRPRARLSRGSTLRSVDGNRVSLDVTTLVRTWQADPTLLHSLIVEPASDEMVVTFYSRETRDASRRPRLIIRCALRRQQPPAGEGPRDVARQDALEQLRQDSAGPVAVP